MLSPGLSINRLIEQAPDDMVRSLMDNTIIELLQILNFKLLTGDALRKIALKLIKPESLLITPEHRLTIINFLSHEKREELSSRMGLAPDSTSREISDAAGVTPEFNALLSFFGIEPEVLKQIEPLPQKIFIDPSYKLFEHQRQAADKVWSKLEKGDQRVILHLPTGGGKTRTAMHTVARHLNNYYPSVVVWLAHSRELLEQAADEFTIAWQYLGNRTVNLYRMWGSSEPDISTIKDGIIVAGLQKMNFYRQKDLNSFLRLADRAHLTVIDEAHVAVAPTYRQIVEGLWAKRRDNRLLGLTATPGRTWADIEEDRQLSELFNYEKVTLEVEGFSDPVSYLINSGYLAKPTFKLLNVKPGLELTEFEQKALANRLDIPKEILDRLGDNPIRNINIIGAVIDLLSRHQRVLVFAPSVSAAEKIDSVLNAQGYFSQCVTADTPLVKRKRAIEVFRSSRPDHIALCNYGVLTTGFDAPRTSAALIARPTLSLVLYSQMVGRATRGIKAGGNETAEIITVVDPELPGFGKIEEAFRNWEDIWDGETN